VASQHDIEAIAKYGAAFDHQKDPRFPHSQSPQESFMHAMRGPNETTEQAEAKMWKFVWTMLDAAKAEASTNREAALRDFAVGVHPLMDMTSPPHETSGHPALWSGGVHPGHYISELASPLGPAMSITDPVLLGAYRYVFGSN
jgi:hypothetical protein